MSGHFLIGLSRYRIIFSSDHRNIEGLTIGDLRSSIHNFPLVIHPLALDDTCLFWSNKPTTRRSRDEIIELFEACQATLGRVPGNEAFQKVAAALPWL
jgi:hypothetical protein